MQVTTGKGGGGRMKEDEPLYSGKRRPILCRSLAACGDPMPETSTPGSGTGNVHAAHLKIPESEGARGRETNTGMGRPGVYCAGIFKQSMEARKRVGIVLSYRPAKLHSLAELVPWNRF
jgi:hypothetical protein